MANTNMVSYLSIRRNDRPVSPRVAVGIWAVLSLMGWSLIAAVLHVFGVI